MVLRLALFVVVACAALWPQVAGAIPIRVRGEAVLRGQLRFDEEQQLELRGQLSDEARLPIEGATVTVATKGVLWAADAVACPDLPVPLLRAARPDEIAASTNELGELCLRWRRAPDRGRAELRFDGDAFHGSADLQLDFDRQAQRKVRTAIEFDPRPQVIDLDQAATVVGARLSVQPATVHAPLQGLTVTLSGREASPLGTAAAAGDGKARFRIDTADLGPPGSVELEVSFAGTDELAAASDAQTVTLRAVAPLDLAEPLAEAVDGEAVAARVRLEPHRGVVDDGVIEALHRGGSVGSAPVRCGQALVDVRLPRGSAGPQTLTLRYLPASPWWTAG
ncbi:MAG: hypothetical protein JRI23_05200, partial [Deltaproteobacteria bacterium]|nr:hypothetical protein [Deltaproteobacteria bacterium]MBW2530948.1 hypothetical protein [Deltaproteobacteria bacterium]